MIYRPFAAMPLAAPLACALVCVLSPHALAAGGAHVVDDAGVETPGRCHLESWLSSASPGTDFINLSPACTFEGMPRMEIGAGIQHVRGGGHDNLFGPALKLNLHPVETGLGVALSAAAGWSGRTDRLETAGLIMPLSLQPSEHVRVNLNAGWLYARSGKQPNEGFLGGQIEADIGHDLCVMTEGFARSGGQPGAQIGLRWTPGGGDFDIDLLSGWHVDGTTARTHTIGLTWRI